MWGSHIPELNMSGRLPRSWQEAANQSPFAFVAVACNIPGN